MALRLTTVTLDCEDAARVGTFWASALGRPLDDDATPEFASIGAAGDGPGWYFNQVPEPKTGKNRVHVDLGADDREAEIARLVELGAHRVGDHGDPAGGWTVLADVEGNEFCVS